MTTSNDLPLEAYYPKGSLCMNCQKAEDGEDCSQLPFSSYRVIDSDRANNIKYVRCEQFETHNKEKL